ncbi:hypothetical protein AVEN_165170-1 [Araneus ventricosus]|uniref:Uncharacterized protein n=1 Tax=Araneus ventricosus TaxID=182803 RepID=A0A4Y2B5G1_ARAVE|nr:hypothetical protein AVEN_165170-1 [Araneus ventricosus]
MELEVENYIDELVEEHNRELTTEEFTELHCVSQQEDVKESLFEEVVVIGFVAQEPVLAMLHQTYAKKLKHVKTSNL